MSGSYRTSPGMQGVSGSQFSGASGGGMATAGYSMAKKASGDRSSYQLKGKSELSGEEFKGFKPDDAGSSGYELKPKMPRRGITFGESFGSTSMIEGGYFGDQINFIGKGFKSFQKWNDIRSNAAEMRGF